MPGGGKSTIGRHLSKRLGREFVDSDVVIERRIGASIRSFFETEGESAFRDIETSVLSELLQPSAARVIATGGGAVLREANRLLLSGDGVVVVYLHSTPDELYRRLRHDTQRPLLQVADPLGRLQDLYTQRDPLYREVADFIVETGRPAVPSLVNTILMQLELAGVISREAGGSGQGPAPA